MDENEEASVQARKATTQLFQEYKRPINGIRGPQKKLDKPIVTKTPALEALITSTVVPNSSAMSVAVENIDVLLKLAVNAVNPVTKTTRHFVKDEAVYPGALSSGSIMGVGGVAICFSAALASDRAMFEGL